jgi:hypothetical protein
MHTCKRSEKNFVLHAFVSTANPLILFLIIIVSKNLSSQKIIDKIFQPLFTTKPTSSGLSLRYDIIKR